MSSSVPRHTEAEGAAGWLQGRRVTFGAVIVAGLAVVTAAVIGVPARSVAVASTACSSSWTAQASPSQLKNLDGIKVFSDADAWAVGIRLGHPSASAAVHWDGASWAETETVNPGRTQNTLTSADGASPGDVWAVGYYDIAGGKTRTLIEHWDGSAWTRVASPNATVESNSLTSVTAISANDVWAAGFVLDQGVRKTLTMHWGGTRWSLVASPSPGSNTNSIQALAGLGAANVWAVGYTSSGSGYQPLKLHWTGSSWVRVTASGDGAGGDQILTSVSASAPGDVWAAGYQTTGTEYTTFVQHYNGSSWKTVSTPSDAGGYTVLRAVAAQSHNDVWAVGTSYDAVRASVTSYTMHWDGTTWTKVAAADVGPRAELLAVAIDPTGETAWTSGRPGVLQIICPRSSALSGASSEAASAPFASPALVARRRPRGAPLAARSAVDVATAAGVAELTKTRGAVVADFTGDGLPDIFLGKHQAVARLYKNNGDGTFTEIEKGAFPKHDRHWCGAGDFNADDRMDIFCETGSDLGTEEKRDELWIQQPDGRFTDEAAAWGVLDPFGRGRNVVVLDVNNDGLPDIYSITQSDRADGLPSPSRLFINVGGTHFRDASEYGLDVENAGGCGLADDVNGDGWTDLLVCRSPTTKLYLNRNGTRFTDETAALGVPNTPSDAALGDLNGDARPDLVAITDTSVDIYLQNSAGALHLAKSIPTSHSVAVALGDVDNDGDEDIYVTNGATTNGTNGADVILANSGTGAAYTKLAVPSTTAGQADEAVPIDYNGDHRVDFLVLNGKGKDPAPVQLITVHGG